MAADLTLGGRDVIFCAHPGASGPFLDTLERGQIELTGFGRTGIARPWRITTDLAETLRESRQIHVLLPAIRHAQLFDVLAPHLTDEHEVLIWSGNFGSLRLAAFLRERGAARPLLAETSTVPYSTRIARPGVVHIQALANWVLLGALPGSRTSELVARCEPLWPGVLRPAAHVLQAAFNNTNTIVHAPPVLLNIGRIERSGGDFYVYKEGVTPAVVRVIRALYRELQSVALAYGFDLWPYQPADFDPPASVVTAVFRGPQAEAELSRSRGPSGPRHRFLTEDIPYSLVPIGRLGRVAGVATPVLDALVNLGAVVAEEDFHTSAPDLTALGLPTSSPAELLRSLL
jgi:opine dehydrogenase